MNLLSGIIFERNKYSMKPSVTVTQTQLSTRSEYMPWTKDIKRHWQYYLMALPALLVVLVYGYGPLFGLSFAFIDYSPARGISGSEWVGLQNFQTAFNNPFFTSALRNTVIIKGLQTLIGFPSAVILALLLNEVRLTWFKRTVQTATILPYFISWIVVAAIFQNLLSQGNGVVNEILKTYFGLKQDIPFLSDPVLFRWLMILQDTWKFCGFFAMIYLATMAQIDPTLYEAAMVDGANRFQQALYVTIPGILPTMITLFVLLIGYLIIGSFDQVFAQYNVSVFSTSDILETFTFRLGLQQSKYGLATAVGFFQSVIAAILVILTNAIVKKFGQKEGLF